MPPALAPVEHSHHLVAVQHKGVVTQRTKNQHYAPQLYLRQFVGEQPKNMVWTYDSERDKVRPSTVENTGAEGNFYSLKLADGSYYDELETWLAGVEGAAAAPYRTLLDGDSPLEFSGVTANTIATDDPALTCAPRASAPIAYTCQLNRSSFGGVAIDQSNVLVNDKGKVMTMDLTADLLFDDTVVAALSAKYGKPSSDVEKNELNKLGGPYKTRTVDWPLFDEGATLVLYRGETRLLMLIRFPQNIPAREKPKVDF